MAKAFGIVASAGRNIWVEGLQSCRPIGAISFLGRYRVIDFSISNMSNSGIDQIQVYLEHEPRSLVQHLGTGRHYNLNSKRGGLQLLFSESVAHRDIYNTDVASYLANMEQIKGMYQEYVVLAPSYMIYTADFDDLLKKHISSAADISILYHNTDNAKEAYLNCKTLNLNRQKGVEALVRNDAVTPNKSISMDTYIMKKDLFIHLIEEAHKFSSVYSLADMINKECTNLDVRGIEHTGYFAAITDFPSFYKANMELIDYKIATKFFTKDWPIYTRTNDSCPTQYFDSACVKSSVVSNGCSIEGTIENSVIGRGCTIGKGAVIKNSVILPECVIGDNVHIENYVMDKHASAIHENVVIGEEGKPGCIKRNDVL